MIYCLWFKNKLFRSFISLRWGQMLQTNWTTFSNKWERFDFSNTKATKNPNRVRKLSRKLWLVDNESSVRIFIRDFMSRPTQPKVSMDLSVTRTRLFRADKRSPGCGDWTRIKRKLHCFPFDDIRNVKVIEVFRETDSSVVGERNFCRVFLPTVVVVAVVVSENCS